MSYTEYFPTGIRRHVNEQTGYFSGLFVAFHDGDTLGLFDTKEKAAAAVREAAKKAAEKAKA